MICTRLSIMTILLHSPHMTLVCVFSVLEDESTRLSAVELKQFIITGLNSLFGEVRSFTRYNSHSFAGSGSILKSYLNCFDNQLMGEVIFQIFLNLF